MLLINRILSHVHLSAKPLSKLTPSQIKRAQLTPEQIRQAELSPDQVTESLVSELVTPKPQMYSATGPR